MTDYFSAKLCGLVHSGGDQRQRPKGGRIGGRHRGAHAAARHASSLATYIPTYNLRPPALFSYVLFLQYYYYSYLLSSSVFFIQQRIFDGTVQVRWSD